MGRFIVVILAGALACADARAPRDRLAEAQAAVVQDVLERVRSEDESEGVCLFEALGWGRNEDELRMPGEIVAPSARLVEDLGAAGILAMDGSGCRPESLRIVVGQPEEAPAAGFVVPVMWRVGSGGGTERCRVTAPRPGTSAAECTGQLDF